MRRWLQQYSTEDTGRTPLGELRKRSMLGIQKGNREISEEVMDHQMLFAPIAL